MDGEFKEIEHSGGKLTFNLRRDSNGVRSYQIGWSGAVKGPGPISIISLYVLPEGIPAQYLITEWMKQPLQEKLLSLCYQVVMASDTEGHFGHLCPICDGYWRSGPSPNFCPYCGAQGSDYEFLSESQRLYIRYYCDCLNNAFKNINNGQVTIDIDEIAKTVDKNIETPSFYFSEKSQQCKFTCSACGEFNDILGRFGYCSLCRTRNDLADFKDERLRIIRDRLKTGYPPEDCVKDSVSAFDSFMAQLSTQLVNLIPMTESRKNLLSKTKYHNLEKACSIYKEWFDIDIKKGLKTEEYRMVERMFFRRHVYEHKAGEVDQKYLDDSGDTSVNLKQCIHENQEDTHQLLNSLIKMAANTHQTFHEIIPPLSEPIDAYQKEKERIKRETQIYQV